MVIPKQNGKKTLLSILKIILAVGILCWLVQSGKFDLRQLKTIGRPEIWIFGLALFALTVFCNCWRWLQLLRIQGISLPMTQGYVLSLIGLFFNFFIPGGVGGDLVKASFLFRLFKGKKWVIGFATLFDRVLGVSTLLFLVSIMSLADLSFLDPGLASKLHILGWLGGMLMPLVFVTLFFLPSGFVQTLSQRFPEMEKLLQPLSTFLIRPGLLIMPIVVSLLGQLSLVLCFIMLGQYVGPVIPASLYFLLVPLGILSTTLPVTPAGLGIGQAAFYFLFEAASGHGDFGVLAISFLQGVQFLLGLLGGVLFTVYDKIFIEDLHGQPS